MKDQEARPLVFESIRQIPRGKVATYKAVAQEVGINARQVGRILHTNTNPEMYPCHRVVHSDGSMAGGFAFGGPDKQQQLLEAEGVKFREKRVLLGSQVFAEFQQL